MDLFALLRVNIKSDCVKKKKAISLGHNIKHQAPGVYTRPFHFFFFFQQVPPPFFLLEPNFGTVTSPD